MSTSRTTFLGVLAVVSAGYAALAFRMEWRAPSGQIGPGFFPRVIGVLAVVLSLVAITREVRTARSARAGRSSGTDDRAPQPDPPGEGVRRETRTLVVAVAAAVGFVVLLVPLGGVVAASAFLLGLLALLNRGRHVANVAIGIGLPAGMYVLFEVLLDTRLPPGMFG